MGIIPIREQPSLRDIFAANIAGVLVDKSDIKVDSEEYWLRKMDHHSNIQLQTIAFISYKLADALLAERIRKD